jgi:lysophospholipase L1-like esterase
MEGRSPVVLFIGDSVTDCGRRTDPDVGIGNGYVREVARILRGTGSRATVRNRGIDGSRAKDLRSRWTTDCIQLRPDVISVLVGVNDTWRRYDSDDPTTAAAFEDDYRAILQRAARGTSALLVLVEPFIVPISDAQRVWREDLEPKIEVVHRLCSEFGAILVPADRYLNEQAAMIGATEVAFDGVHPAPTGHRLLADLWWQTVSQSARFSAAVQTASSSKL